MAEIPEIASKQCVLKDCTNQAVAQCNNCGLPICSRHGKKVDLFFICMNCS